MGSGSPKILRYTLQRSSAENKCKGFLPPMCVMKAHKKNKKESAGFHVAQNLKIYTAL